MRGSFGGQKETRACLEFPAPDAWKPYIPAHSPITINYSSRRRCRMAPTAIEDLDVG